MTTQKEAYQQALSFIQSGELDKARELLARLIKADKDNLDYWLWMSAVVKTPKERIYCLREVLARRGRRVWAIMGVGAVENASKVRWNTARKILWAWILTIPLTAIYTAIVYWIIRALYTALHTPAAG